MTNPVCTKQNRRGDCSARNVRELCESCASLLSPDELRQREIGILAADILRKAHNAAKGRKLRRCPWKVNYGETCIERTRVWPCAACVDGMTNAALLGYAAKVYDERERQREYWDEYADAEEYAAELKAWGVWGVDWNIELTDCYGDLTERALLIHGLFCFSKPCFIHRGKEIAA